MKKQIPLKKRKNYPPERRLRNRYFRRAKLSEYSFLKILHGFANDIPTPDLALNIRVSAKTIRATYRALRGCLFEATLQAPKILGGSGHFLIKNGQLSERGKMFLAAIAESKIFTNHCQTHTPRNKQKTEYQYLLFEVAVRVFCNIAINKTPDTLYPEETRDAIKTIQEIAQWISENRQTDGFPENYAGVIRRFGVILDQLPRLLEQEGLLALKTKSVAHRFPAIVMYDDLRRYLLVNPL